MSFGVGMEGRGLDVLAFWIWDRYPRGYLQRHCIAKAFLALEHHLRPYGRHIDVFQVDRQMLKSNSNFVNHHLVEWLHFKCS